jgi:DNA-binding SARP family transcriptional activator
MTIRLITLGGLHGTQDGVELGWLRSQLLRAALLTYVTLERKAGRDSVQLLLWPDANASSAKGRLKNSVYELRQALEDDDCIITEGHTILAASYVTADANDFEKAFSSADYEAVMALYRGEFLARVHLVDTNEFESWVDARRARYARMFRKACRSVVEARFNAGDQAGALAAAEAWAEADPAEDEAHHRLIELHALAGNRSQAFNHYDVYKRRLEREGLAPLEQTLQLISALRDAKGSGPGRGHPLSPLERPQDAPAKLANLPAPSVELPTRLGADVDPGLEPSVLPNLEVLRQIGAGAAARVYLARDVALQRLVALKVLPPELASDSTARARFEREARAAARLNHDNIVTVHQVAQLADGTPYLVTEFVEGRNLADTLEAEGVV